MPSLPPVHRSDGLRPEQVQRNRKRDHDQRRGSARQRGYTAEWDRYALAFIAEHPLCCGCQAVGWIEPTTCVDHIEPASRAPDRFWDKTNHQPSCGWHHDRVKQRLEHMLAQGQASVTDMRLNSSLAMRLTYEMRPGAGGYRKSGA